MIQLGALLAKPLLSILPLPDKAKDKLDTVDSLLSGGSGESWIPLARQQATLPVKAQIRGQSAKGERGECDLDGEPLPWVEFDWPPLQIDDCAFHKLSWRFYRNGQIGLELIASKDEAGLDTHDLIGHRIELRDSNGFLVGAWSAAFTIYKGDDHIVFHTSATDEFLPLKLHFGEIADWQDGVGFKI